jgi:hypothetical protein
LGTSGRAAREPGQPSAGRRLRLGLVVQPGASYTVERVVSRPSLGGIDSGSLYELRAPGLVAVGAAFRINRHVQASSQLDYVALLRDRSLCATRWRYLGPVRDVERPRTSIRCRGVCAARRRQSPAPCRRTPPGSWLLCLQCTGRQRGGGIPRVSPSAIFRWSFPRSTRWTDDGCRRHSRWGSAGAGGRSTASFLSAVGPEGPNVWEWVSDWYRPDEYGRLAVAVAWLATRRARRRRSTPASPARRSASSAAAPSCAPSSIAPATWWALGAGGAVDTGTNHLGFRTVASP